MDANEHVLEGKLPKVLATRGLWPAVHSHNGGMGPNTHFRGKDPIDKVWVSKDLVVLGAAYLPFQPYLGDHRPVLLDLCARLVLGSALPRVVPVKARKLNTKVGRIRKKDIEEKFKYHGIYQKLKALEDVASFPATEEVKGALEAVDKLMTELMASAEANCRLLRTGPYDFSPTIKYYVERCWVLKRLIRYKRRRKGNKANIKRAMQRTCNIDRPFGIRLRELHRMLGEAKEEARHHILESPALRSRYLTTKLEEAIEESREADAAWIAAMIRAERERQEWGGIRRVTKKGAAQVMYVEVPLPDGTTRVCTTKEDIKAALAETLGDCFTLAKSSELCHGPLFDLLGYHAGTEAMVGPGVPQQAPVIISAGTQGCMVHGVLRL